MKSKLLIISICMMAIGFASKNKTLVDEKLLHEEPVMSIIENLGHLSDHLGLPINSSSHGLMIDYMIGWTHWLMLILFVGWGLYLIIAIIKFNCQNSNIIIKNILSLKTSKITQNEIVKLIKIVIFI